VVDAVPPPPPPPTPSLRPRAPDDEALLRHLHATVRGAELEATGWPAEQVAALLRSQFDAQEAHLGTAHPDADRSVVLLDGEAIGRLDVDRTDDEVRLLEVQVLPEHRGRGVGTALLGALLAEADARRVPLRLHVEATNPARSLYERAGLRVVSEHGIHLAMERPAPPGPDGGPAVDAEPRAEPVTDRAPAVHAGLDHGFDLATLTADAVRPLLGDRFHVAPPGVDLELVEVTASGRVSGARESFSLLFHGPPEPRLEQGVHPLVHPVHGPLDIFLVALEPTAAACRYEAVFA
jgi:ribosomal protein S18 acetylase RimI-like enzyme